MSPKIFFLFASSVPNFMLAEAVAQRVTGEDIYGDVAGAAPSNITAIVIACLLILGILKSKGIRLFLGIYLLMLIFVCGGAALAFNLFGKSGALIYLGGIIVILYFYDNSPSEKTISVTSKIKNTPSSSVRASLTRSDFNSETEYYKYAVTFKTAKKYHWYKTQNGIGIKETGEYFSWSNVEKVSDGFSFGYWINLSNEANRGRFFIEEIDIEKIDVDYKNNKFVSRCPSCKQKCRGNVFLEVSVRCPKCGFRWSQRVN